MTLIERIKSDHAFAIEFTPENAREILFLAAEYKAERVAMTAIGTLAKGDDPLSSFEKDEIFLEKLLQEKSTSALSIPFLESALRTTRVWKELIVNHNNNVLSILNEGPVFAAARLGCLDRLVQCRPITSHVLLVVDKLTSREYPPLDETKKYSLCMELGAQDRLTDAVRHRINGTVDPKPWHEEEIADTVTYLKMRNDLDQILEELAAEES